VRHRAGGEQEERQEAHYVRDGIDGKFYATTGDYPLVILGGAVADASSKAFALRYCMEPSPTFAIL